MAARSVCSEIEWGTDLVLQSARSTRKPRESRLLNTGSGPFGLYGKSTDLVHGTPVSAVTIVLEGPSGKSWGILVPSCSSRRVPPAFPRGDRANNSGKGMSDGEGTIPLAGMIAANPDRKVIGRTRWQKTVYLLQRKGFSTALPYSLRLCERRPFVPPVSFRGRGIYFTRGE
jgi:hypothetical protein